MKLHLLGIPHTISNIAHSHCAFSSKIVKFSAMMRPLGYEIVHYGVEGAETEATEHVEIMTRAEQDMLRGHDGSDPAKFVGDDGRTDSPLYIEFNKRLRSALLDRVTQSDLVLLPFGHGHGQALDGLPFLMIESGIGYPTLYPPAQFKIFESYAWMHFHQGRENRGGKNYEWVIPNYFDVDDWDVELAPDMNTVVFLGRICEMKGMATVVEVAKHRPDLKFVISGQGDHKPYMVSPNIYYRAPLVGRERSEYLGNARACIMPTLFTEPFGGVAVEAMMCGTPVLSTTYGAFSETIEDEVTGFRCHTLGDFLSGLDRAPKLDRRYIAERARRLYGYDRVGKMYDRAFGQIADLRGAGWYTERGTW
jgi:glycosyltransferase involved in cell wall biosynthesis